MATGQRPRFHCDRCESSFQRPEHLKRHKHKHDDVLSYVCNQCQKAFSRSDSLVRHELIHSYETLQEGYSTPNQSTHVISTQARACTECAKARARCSKERLCSRCAAKSLDCVYPSSRRRKRSAGEDGIQQTMRCDLNAAPHSRSHRLEPITAHQTSPSPPVGPDELGIGALPTLQHYPGLPNGNLGDIDAVVFPDNIPSSRLDVSTPYPGQLNPAFDDSINWLPTNFGMDIDYRSILGFGMMVPAPIGDEPLMINALPNLASMNENDSPVATSLSQRQPRGMETNVEQQQNTHTSPDSYLSPLSPSSNATIQTKRKGLYVNGSNGARRSCTERDQESNVTVHGAQPLSPASETVDVQDSQYGFPNVSQIFITGLPTGDTKTPSITQSTFEEICCNFDRLCLGPEILFAPFVDGSFPLLHHLNYFIHLYYEHFHPVMPILHSSTDINLYWPLALSVAAVGCHYAEGEEFVRCVSPLQEYLRRALFWTTEHGHLHSPLGSLAQAQAVFLNHIGLLYSGLPRMWGFAHSSHSRLLELVRTEDFLASAVGGIRPLTGIEDAEWKTWLLSESRRRLGYAIWLIDAMQYYQFGTKPSLKVSDGRAPLPADVLWEANTASEWRSAYANAQENPSLSTAVQGLYLEGKVNNDIGEFSRVLLIHGLYQETWDVENYFSRPLGLWQPSDERAYQSRNDTTADDTTESSRSNDCNRQVWLPEISTYSNWRNAGCDAIDVLHWAANGTIARLNGAEHPTVFHLHFSRTILLVPYAKIRKLAISIVPAPLLSSNPANDTNHTSASDIEHDVLQWAQRDEHKARLAVLHAGCLFWHVRRYSTRSFYEPAAVFLATLTLWAYASYTSLAPRNTRQASLASGSSSSDEAKDPMFIWLDRPNDDEMVQLFVRWGHPSNMRAFISGVGNICSRKGPRRLLKQGRKILSKLVLVWSYAREYVEILESLEDAMAQRTKQRQREQLTET